MTSLICKHIQGKVLESAVRMQARGRCHETAVLMQRFARPSFCYDTEAMRHSFNMSDVI